MAAPALSPGELLNIPELRVLRLDQLCLSTRYRQLETLGLYAEGRQHEALQYNWDGTRQGYAGEADIKPGWYVPLKHRRPNVRFNLGKLIVGRLTAMALGEESWPQINVSGDEDAEDYVQALATEAKLQQRLQEARSKGGAAGTAVLSFAFVDGMPRVKSHEAKHMFPLRWADRDEHVLGAVLKVYAYTRTVWVDSAPKEKRFYFARYWDERTETVWDPIPQELAQTNAWSWKVPSRTIVHDYGECPVYWCQNLEDGDREDGISDIDQLPDTFDRINHLLSATTKGTIANVDPTLVIKDDPGKNQGVVHKGEGQAIFSKGGADYLELKGESVKTAKELARELTQFCLETAGVVIGDPEKMGAKAQSSLTLKMLYLPMCNQCDLLRVQYGGLITAVLRGMLRAARKIEGTEPGPVVVTEDGYRLQHKPVVVLPPRIEVEGEGDEKIEKEVPRSPGTSERIELKWPQYFPPALPDIKLAVDAATAAQGRTISRKTGVAFTAPMFGVVDIDEELALIDVEREAQALLMGQLDTDENVPGFKGGQDGGEET
jgi:hypothetical protein